MTFSYLINQILLPFGGVSAVLIGLASFLAHISSKRIINGEVARHKRDLEEFKSTARLQMEAIKSDFKLELLKSESYTSISKEMYQELFSKRIEAYEKLINLKRDIEKSLVDNAEYIEFHDDDPSYFTNIIEKINDATREHPMLISNDLAEISDELYKKSIQIFSDAKVKAFYAELSNSGDDYGMYNAMIEAENDELRRMLTECGDLYEKWLTQLNIDLSKIRGILDSTNAFLESEH